MRADTAGQIARQRDAAVLAWCGPHWTSCGRRGAPSTRAASATASRPCSATRPAPNASETHPRRKSPTRSSPSSSPSWTGSPPSRTLRGGDRRPLQSAADPAHAPRRSRDAALVRVRVLADRLDQFADVALKVPDRELYAALATDLRAALTETEPTS